MVEQCDKQLILHSSQVNWVTFLFNSAVGFIYGKIFIVPHPEHLTYHTHPSALARLPTSAKRLHRQEKPAPTGCCRLGSAKAQRRGKVDKTPATHTDDTEITVVLVFLLHQLFLHARKAQQRRQTIRHGADEQCGQQVPQFLPQP